MASLFISTFFPKHYPVHLLHNTQISSIAIPHQFITIIPVNTHVSAVLETFSRANIISAPVIREDGSLLGFVDFLDLVALFEQCRRASVPMDEFFKTPVQKAMELPLSSEIPVLQGVPRHPMVELAHNTSMAELFERFARGSLHRVAMTKEGKVVAIITQRDVLRWIVKNIKAFEEPSLIFNANHTIAELGFGGPSDRPAATISEDANTAEAFARMRYLSVSCLPVVNTSGVVTHVLSTSDLRSLSASNTEVLDLPLKDFLAKRPPTPLISATLTDKFGDVLRKLNESGKHRVVVVDQESKPKCVISLTDIIPLFAVAAKK